MIMKELIIEKLAQIEREEDIKILQLVFNIAFIVFGFTVDFFIDWPFMMLYFI